MMQTEDWELKTPPTLKLLRTLWELKTGYGVRVAGIELRAWSAGVSLAAEGMLYPARLSSEIRGAGYEVRGTGYGERGFKLDVYIKKFEVLF
jgi:hypothetical protein